MEGETRLQALQEHHCETFLQRLDADPEGIEERGAQKAQQRQPA